MGAYAKEWSNTLKDYLHQKCTEGGKEQGFWGTALDKRKFVWNVFLIRALIQIFGGNIDSESEQFVL